MTQPAVSNHLHALEERFGVALLVRGLRTTDAGGSFACGTRAAGARRSCGPGSRDGVSHGTTRATGRGASWTPGELLLPRLATCFSARYPEVALDVRVADTEETLAALFAGVVGRAVDHPKLVGVVIEEDELVPVVSADDRLADRPEEGPVSAVNLSARAFVLREEGLRSAGVRPRVAMELGSNAAVTGAVAAGAGVCVVPKLFDYSKVATLVGSTILAVLLVDSFSAAVRRRLVY